MYWRKVIGKLLRLARKEQGSFTLESTFVFPVLLGFILLFILFGMYMYQKVVLYYAASSTAERAAFAWDNSNRDPRSGMLPAPSYDPLYRRLGEDGMLGSLFGLASDSREAAVVLPLADDGDEEEKRLALSKMERAAQWLEQAGLSYEGRIGYSNGVLKRTVDVRLEQPLSAETAETGWLKREPKTAASASIVDPAEFIRSVDLVRYYTAKFAARGAGAGQAQAQAQAGQVLAPYAGASGTQPP
ncbi:TadE/TadG family type IV pilus assembly protein [Paenibacillus arenilitoris]|uniref:Pilus assembly protein n=1 Tax=Paenibacillus arenilitoris TaxID=2772299 RepID=A0A927CJI3_9BACL|nr:TadE/TadG family type IV pilus assembly protein [Paenibacillus arenilitoris]MBD2867773.1 pilus assembly protein [Paenibacillus arenilitoris]